MIRSLVLAGLVLGASPALAQSLPDLERTATSTVELSNPHDLKLSPDASYLAVSDVGNNRVVLLDPVTLELLGSFGTDEQSGTHDIDFDAEGRMYVADTHNHRIAIYEMNGVEARFEGEIAGLFTKPEGVLVHPDGIVFVAGAGSDNVVAFRDGEAIAELKGLNSPHDLELAPDGTIWLADAGNDRLLQLSTDLEIMNELSGSPYDFNGVRYLDILPNGTIIAADKYTHSVKFIAPDGSLLKVLGDGTAGSENGRFRTPEGVESWGELLWLADSGNNRIVKFQMAFPQPMGGKLEE
ncbi:hypothetical protein [Minwuia sp.]|uniref:hypothetical protein n=1 Tax=Minwuia sp. TaxID=2493630 RepID=UPI003A931FD6